MQHEDKTKEQLIKELTDLRSQVAELKASEAGLICAEKALNGGKILVECEGRVSSDESGRFKQSQASQEEIQARYKALFHDVSDGVAVYKAVDDGKDFVLVEFNEAAETITGVSGSEAIGKKVSDVFPSVKDMGLFVRLQEVWRTGEPIHHPVSKYEDSKIQIWVDNHISKLPSGDIIAVFNDVTNQKIAEDSLRESADLIRILVNCLPVAILYVDSQEKIIFANKTFGSWWGMPGANLAGHTVEDILGNHYSVIQSRLKKALAGQEVAYEERVKYKDGVTRDIVASYVPHIGADGHVKGFACLIQNISELKQAEQEREKLRVQLLQSQKMESLGTLVGGLAHDFNNMLQIMLGYCQLLLDKKKEGEPDYKNLQTVIQTGQEGAELVEKLLAFGQQSQVIPVELDLNDQLRELSKLISRTLPGIIHLDLELTDEPTTVLGDKNQIDQLVMNLAINASEAMPGGGKLTISTKTVSLDDDYCKSHLETKSGAYVTLSVKDNGRGMDVATLAKIFDPFFSTKQRGSTKGTGLGLSVVRGIVQQRGGHITCESEPGKGTEFKIYFPVIEVPKEVTETVTPRVQSGRPETILVVEDNIPVAELERMSLENTGYTVLVATSGQEALDIYRSRQDEISLVLLDLILPEMSGRDCLMELVKIDPSIKVLIASGYAPEDELLREISPLVNGFLHKPFGMTELQNEVRAVLGSD